MYCVTTLEERNTMQASETSVMKSLLSEGYYLISAFSMMNFAVTWLARSQMSTGLLMMKKAQVHSWAASDERHISD